MHYSLPEQLTSVLLANCQMLRIPFALFLAQNNILQFSASALDRELQKLCIVNLH